MMTIYRIYWEAYDVIHDTEWHTTREGAIDEYAKKYPGKNIEEWFIAPRMHTCSVIIDK